MIITIKQLKLVSENQVFAPLTVSEAVLVKNSNEEVTTLDEVLNKKIENIITPIGSGLESKQQGTSIYLKLIDTIKNPNDKPENTKILYNSKGIIVNTAPVENLTISVDNKSLIYNGDDSRNINFGDDFKLDDNNNIILKWTNHGNV